MQRQRLLLLVPLALLLVPFLVWPAILGFLSSFTDYTPTQAHIRFVGARNYAGVLADGQSRLAFRNIGGLTLMVVPAELIIGFAIAYALREPFRGHGLVRVLLLIPWLVSPVATGVMWHFLYSTDVGLLNFWLASLRLPLQPSPLGLSGLALLAVAMVDTWRKAPLVSFLLLPGLLTLPSEIWEQIRVEGAPLGSQVRHILLPWLRPLLLTVALLLIADTLSTFDSVLMLTGGGPGSRTLVPALYSYQQAFQAHSWPAGVTLAWLVTGVVLLVGIGYLVMVRGEIDEEEA